MGRPKGSGKNVKILLGLEPEQRLWDVSYRQMHNLQRAAVRLGFKLRYRRIPGTELYVIWKRT